jgi:hypothetical protein
MSHDARGEPTPEELKHVLQEAILRNYPNPERKGCPGAPILKEVAGQKLPFEHQRWEHISHCSPCYREFLEFRNEVLQRRAHEKRRSRVLLAGAAGLFVIVAIAYWTARNRPPLNPSPQVVEQPAVSPPAPPPPQPEPPIVTAVLNLESESTTRTLPQPGIPAVVGELQRVPRGRLALSIYLPLGSQPGSYEIHLLKTQSDSTPLATFSGTAKIENGLTVLRISPDFSSQVPGTYIIAIRHEKESWRYYRVALS